MNSGAGARRLLRGLTGALGVLVVALIVVIHALVPGSAGRQVGLDQLSRMAAAHDVVTAVFLDQDDRVALTVRATTGGPTYPAWAAYPANGAELGSLMSALVNSGAAVEVDQQSGKRVMSLLGEFILPLLLLADLFGIFILLARGGSSQVRELFAFSRLANRKTSPGSTPPATFRDVAAAAETVVELTEIRDYLRSPGRYAQLGAVPPKGVLLHGPPGCGKTLLARALAGEAGVPFFSISGSEFVESLVGVGAARVRDLFRQAKAAAPAIVFVDELDAAGRRRGAGIGGGNDEREQTLNELLVQMDGFSATSGIVVVAATNRADILDPALVRPGRFDRHIAVEPPDVAGRLAILSLHASGRRLEPDVDLDAVARATPGFTGADLANVLNEASLLAARRRAPAVTPEDLGEAIERVVAGPARRARLLDEDERRRLAWHEAGHAVVAAALGMGAQVRRLSIVARGRNAGHADMVRSDRTVLTYDELRAQLRVIMAGTAAEEIAAGQPSTAGEGDLERATTLARHMAGRFGMSPEVGLVRVLAPEGEVFLGRDYLSAQHASPTTLTEVDRAVRSLVEQARADAVRLLAARRRQTDSVAAALLQHETLDEERLAPLLASVPPDRSAPGATAPPAATRVANGSRAVQRRAGTASPAT
ncbi:MAG TPA: ATP-dependent zinc metalloprotease FtsH [Acidimicrobiales bacterium]|nr:ATP-dependent zinc metalloprotease FtsH [Acidimicrobiales bacterium]